MNTRAVSLLLELLFTQALYDGGCPALMGVVSRFVREFLSLESGGTRNRTGDTMIFSLVPFSIIDRREQRWTAPKPNHER
jgi:hypothetical protein